MQERYNLSTLRAARRLFAEGSGGKILFKRAISEARRTPQGLQDLRVQFGPGKAGSMAFSIIATKTTCEAPIVSEDGQRVACTSIADRTVDFDALGNCEHIACCSESHAQVAQARIVHDALTNGKRLAKENGKQPQECTHWPSFGKNGFGRY